MRLRGEFVLEDLVWFESSSLYKGYDDNIASIKGSIEELKGVEELPVAVKKVEEYKLQLEKDLIKARVARSLYERARSTSERLTRIAAFEEELKTRKAELGSAIVSIRLEEELYKKFGAEGVSDPSLPQLIEYLKTGNDAAVQKVEEQVAGIANSIRAKVGDVDALPKDIKTEFADEVSNYERAKLFFEKLVNKKLWERKDHYCDSGAHLHRSGENWIIYALIFLTWTPR